MTNCRRMMNARRRVRQSQRNQLTFSQRQTLRNVLMKQVRKGVKSLAVIKNWLERSSEQIKMIKSVLIDRGKLVLGIREGNSEKTVRLSLSEVIAICN